MGHMFADPPRGAHAGGGGVRHHGALLRPLHGAPRLRARVEAFSGSPTGTASPGRARSTPAAAPARASCRCSRFEVTGCDQSPAMLEVAAARAGSRVELRCADLRRLDRLGEFDLITRLDDVANYLTEPGDLTSALRGLARNLRPGGVLVFDANTLATYRSFFRETFALEARARDALARARRRGLPARRPGARLWTCSASARTAGARDQRPRAASSRRGRRPGLHRRRRPSLPRGLRAGSPAVNFDAALDELRHSKAIYLVTREGQGRR